MLSYIGEEVGDIPSDIGTGCLDTSDDLGSSELVSCQVIQRLGTYLRNDIQPCIDLDTTETTGHRMADLVVGAELEP